MLFLVESFKKKVFKVQNNVFEEGPGKLFSLVLPKIAEEEIPKNLVFLKENLRVLKFS